MRKLPFSEKNNFVVKNKSGAFFDKDIELFKRELPSHRLNNSLARANKFTKESLDGQMLYLLLDKISPDEILKNREDMPESAGTTETPPVDTSASEQATGTTETPPVETSASEQATGTTETPPVETSTSSKKPPKKK